VRFALDFCAEHLAPGGAFLVKVFQGEEFAGLLKEMKALFREVGRSSLRRRGRSRGRPICCAGDTLRKIYSQRALKPPPAPQLRVNPRKMTAWPDAAFEGASH
jgi:hypothetical protein